VDNALFTERFARRRELFLRCLRGIASAAEGLTFRLVNRDFTFGWSFECGDQPHAWRSEGGLEFAVSYCAHMIDSGLSVAFGAVFAASGETTVWLKAWERPQPEPAWPGLPDQAVTCVWSPVSSRSELSELLRQ